MNRIELHDRTKAHVKEYYHSVQDVEIRRMIPLKAQSLEEALNEFYHSLSPDSRSYGCTIYADGVYVGDVWCYCIDFQLVETFEEDGVLSSYFELDTAAS